MINLLLILAITIILITTNYIALIYGIRIGKAMQHDIPPVPIEPVTNAVKRVCRLIKDKTSKTYYQRKQDKEEFNIYD